MSLFVFASLSLFLLSAGLAIFIFLQASNRTHFVWACFNSVVAIWGLGLFFIGISKTEPDAIFHWRWTFAFNTFIPILFYHLIYSFCKLKEKWLLGSIYIEGFLFLPVILLTNYFVKKVVYIYNSLYYFEPTFWYYIWLALLASISCFSFVRLFNFVKKAREIERTGALYLFWGMLLGFLGGFTLALPSIGVHIYPAWHFMICVYAGIITFAILRHHFFDIRVTLTRLLIPIAFFVIFVFIFCFTHFEMNLFALAGISLGIACFLLAYIIACYARHRMHWIWALFNFSLGVWGLGTFFVGVLNNKDQALIAWKLAYVGVLFVPIFFYHMIYLFCNLKNKRLLSFAYLQGILVVLLNLVTNHFVGKLEYLFNSFYYHRITKTYLFFFIIWIYLVAISFRELYKFIQKSEGLKKTQALYLFWGMLLGFLGGTTVVAPAFGLEIYPFGHFFICIYAAIVTYAIFKYQLMDIRMAITRLGVFVIVYSLVLGIPFGLAYWGKSYLLNIFGTNWYWVPLIVTTIFATAGPFIYLFLQHKAEDRLLKEERRIQQFLMQASSGMTTIRDLKKLLGLIIHLLSNILKLNNAAIYLFDSNSNQYVLKAIRFKRENPITISTDDPLIQQLKKDKSPLVYEEIKMRADTENNSHLLREISSQMKDLSASVIVSTAVENNLLGFLILGERKSSRMYTPDLLNALAVLSNQAALAIENARFYESDKENQALLYQSATLSEMGVMADSMGHQIKNHIQKMMGLAGTEAGMLEEFLKQGLSYERATELLKRYLEVFNRIEEQGKEGGELIASISKFSRLPQEAFKQLKIPEILNTANDMLQFMIKFDQIDYEVDIAENLPSLYAHPILSEAFVNLIDNAYDAIKEREERLNEPGYRGKIIFQASLNGSNQIEIKISDNGVGIERANLSHLFLPFYTTKATAAKGTGLGLYVLKRIIDNHKGRITVESEHLKGTAFTITLPIKAGV